jgi:hypothetical protein
MAMDRLRSSYNIACQSSPVLFVLILMQAIDSCDVSLALSHKSPRRCTANCDKSNIGQTNKLRHEG